MGGAAILRAISELKLKPDYIIIEAVFDRMLSTVKNRFSAMKIPSFPAAHILCLMGGWQLGFSSLKHNPVDYAENVNCPTLMLHGEKDPRATIDDAMNVYRNLSCPKQIEIFSEINHESCHNANPEKWKTAVLQFIKDHPAR